MLWVALDSWDVDPEDLEVAGQPWAAVIPTDVDNRIDDGIQPLPLQGWREVAIQVEDPSPLQGRLFAAPEGKDWSVAYLSAPLAEGKPILSAGSGVRLRPGKPSRRHGLRLTSRPSETCGPVVGRIRGVAYQVDGCRIRRIFLSLCQ